MSQPRRMAKIPLHLIPFLSALSVWVICSTLCSLKVQHILASTISTADTSSLLRTSKRMAFPDAPACAPFSLDKSDFSIDGDRGPFAVAWTTHSPEPGLLLLDLTFSSSTPAKPSPMSLVWTVPSLGVDGVWTPKISMDKSTFWEHSVVARATTFAPVLSLRTATGHSRLTFAVADALNRTKLFAHIREEDVTFLLKVFFFSEPLPAISQYTTQIRLDLRDVALPRALSDVSSWWAQQPGYAPLAVPRAALAPVYSTWYNFHQNLDVPAILSELDIAQELGYRTLIVDDGWQTLDSQRGYAYTGDWRAERIPDMRGFVDAVHAKGMNFILWYSLPFMGMHASRRAEFASMFLKKSGELGTYVLDPRFPEVREYIISTYETALREWDLDGFKLDFIDEFVANPYTTLTASDGRDYASVNAAVDRLMTDVLARLRARKPDILIEFRQRYIGPLMRKYGNMFRACDCPNNADVNRARVVDLRLLAGNTAVHADMLLWHRDESVEHAALQMLSSLFAVPQVSVRLRELPSAHRQMLRFWTRYWTENEHVLMHGDFAPTEPTAAYPLIIARAEGKAIVAVYAERVVEMSGELTVDIVNAKATSLVFLRFKESFGEAHVTVFDTTGNSVASRRENFAAGVHEIGVPPSGLLQVRKLS